VSSTPPNARHRILRATWSLVARDGADASLADISQEAGVSRQALYLHFGSRAGLLLAAVRHHDTEAGLGQRFEDAVTASSSGANAARAWMNVWLDYLPEVASVAQRLEAAASSDAAAHEALSERMELQRANLTRVFEWVRQDGALRADLTPSQAAEMMWSLVHVTAWQQLVVECGWTAAGFALSRLALLDRAILKESV